MDNPFQEEICDLLTLDTKDIADPSSAKAVSFHHGKANSSVGLSRKECSMIPNAHSVRLYQKNKVAYFRQGQVSSSSKDKELKVNCQLF